MNLKDQTAIFSLISTLASVASVPGSFFGVYKDLGDQSSLIKWVLAVVTGICVGGIIWLIFYFFTPNRKKSENSSNLTLSPEPNVLNNVQDTNTKEPAYILGCWKLHNQETVVWLDENGDRVKVRQHFKIVRIKPCKFFYFRLINESAVQNLVIDKYSCETDSFGNELIVYVHPVGDTDDSTFEFSVSYELVDCFTQKQEFWTFTKAYPEGRVKIVIHVPDSRPLKGFYPKRINKDGGLLVDRFDFIQYRYIEKDEESLLIAELNDLNVGEQIHLKWHW